MRSPISGGANSANRQAGFTLVELIITMVLSVVIAGAVSQVISRPMEAYASSSHRAKLLDAANVTLARVALELRSALPNSVRVGCSGECLEFLRTIDGGRYRAVAPGNVLDFNPASADTQFDVLGPMSNPSAVRTGSNANDCRLGNADCLVIYNTGQVDGNAWEMDNIATITNVGASGVSISFSNGAFSSGNAAFPVTSPQQRFHIVDSPISYVCDTSAGTLRRYESYRINANHANVDTHGELLAQSATTAIMADKLSNCTFAYDPGSPTRSGLVSFTMTLSENLYTGHSESVTLHKQAHISNVP